MGVDIDGSLIYKARNNLRWKGASVVCICICMYMYVCMYVLFTMERGIMVGICMYMYVYVCMHVCIIFDGMGYQWYVFVYVYVCMHVCIIFDGMGYQWYVLCMYMYACMYV